MDPVYDAITPAVISLIIVALGGAIFKVFVNRSFKAFDDAIASLNREVEKLKQSNFVDSKDCENRIQAVYKVESTLQILKEDVIRIQESVKSLIELKSKLGSLDSIRADFLEKFMSKPDFNRDITMLTDQIESILQKVNQLDERILNRINGKRSGGN